MDGKPEDRMPEDEKPIHGKPSDQKPEDGDPKPSPRLFDLMTMGLSSALMVGGGLGIGIGIDAWLHSSPLGTFAGLAFGVVAAVGATIRQARRYL